MITLEKLEKAGFTVNIVPRIDMKPRKMFEVTLSRDGKWVSLIANEDAVENRKSILYDHLVNRYHWEISHIKDIGRGDLRMTNF
jgi:uncharacterized protein (DUF1015 family)